ncbi:hypothetical protein Droror1_Dr00012719 [Drosera rotundifolia]
MDARKRTRPDGVSNGGIKRSKPETESTNVGSKSKPCTKFYSTAGCPFGESCHFLHYVPGGYNAVAQIMNLGPAVPPPRNLAGPTPASNGGPASTVKSRMCKNFNTPEGCRYGDKCHFAHAEWELGTPVAPSYEEPYPLGGLPGRFMPRNEPPPPGPTTGFGASASAKIPVDGSLAGAIIGKGGVNSKQICRETGAKLSIRDHESNPNLKNIELEGTIEQISQASTMVKELIASLNSTGRPAKPPTGAGGPPRSANNYKTKLCDNFAKGSCTFAERCHFAHGAAELRSSGV